MLIFNHPERCGLLPLLASEDNPDTFQDQIAITYAHGGGWNEFHGFDLIQEKSGKYHLQYPADPPMRELARAPFREQTVVLFEYSWVAVINPDGSYNVSRMD